MNERQVSMARSAPRNDRYVGGSCLFVSSDILLGGKDIGLDCLRDWTPRSFGNNDDVAICVAGTRATPASERDMLATAHALSELV